MAKLSLTDITTGYFSAAAYNANNTLIETALENTLSRDGTTPNTMSVDLDMNSNKITNLTDGTNNQDAVTVSQLANASLVTAATLAALQDTNITTPVTNTFLVYDGAEWVDGEIQIDDSRIISFGSGGDVTFGYDAVGNDFDIDTTGAGTGVDFDINLGATGFLNIREAGLDRIKLDIFQGFLEIHDGFHLRLYEQAEVDYADIYHNGTNLVFDESAGGNFIFEGGGNLLVREGGILAVYDATNVDNLLISHDGTDINFDHTNTTDMNILSGMQLKVWGPLDTGAIHLYHNDSNAVLSSTVGDIQTLDNFDMRSGANFIIRDSLNTTYTTLSMGAATRSITHTNAPAVTEAGAVTHSWEADTSHSWEIGGTGIFDILATRADLYEGADLRLYNLGNTSYFELQAGGTDAFIDNGTLTDLEFSGWTDIRMNPTGSLVIDNGTTALSTPEIELIGDAPSVMFLDDGAAANNQVWVLGNASEVFRLRAYNDALSASQDALVVQRTANSIDSVTLYADTSGVFATQIHDATGATSGAQVMDHAGTLRDVGFNTVGEVGWAANDALEAAHAGNSWGKANTTARTLTLPTSSDLDFPVEAMTQIMNLGTAANLIVNEDAGNTVTLYYVSPGSGQVDTAGGCTVGPGGIATLWRRNSTTFYIWGSEITP